MKKIIIIMLLLVPIMLLAEEETQYDVKFNPGSFKESQANTNPFPFVFSGSFWVDQGYMKAESGDDNIPGRDQTYQAGRFELAADYIKEYGNFYSKARAKFAVNSNYVSASTSPEKIGFIPLDSYIELGLKNNSLGNKDGQFLDVRFGRFEGWELYHTGMGLDQYSDELRGGSYIDPRIPGIYELNTVRGYFNNGQGQAAMHFYFTDIFKFELAGSFGVDNNEYNYYGIRPIVEI